MLSPSKVIEKYFGQQSIEEIRKADFERYCAGTVSTLTPLHTKLQLPYTAAHHPGIPSIEEIEEAMKTNKFKSKLGAGVVCSVGAVVVKISANTSVIQEAEDLLYLQSTGSKLRTPTVYAAFSRDITEAGRPYRVYYLVQEYLEGQSLNAPLWLSMDVTVRKKICSSLVEQLRLLRSIPAPLPSSYGRVHNQGWLEDSPMFQTCRKELCGPYNSYEDFCEAAVSAAQLYTAVWRPSTGEEQENTRDLLSKYQSALKTWSSTPAFTHVDPNLSNIIVRQIPGSNGGEDEWEATLIDWERSGWFPDWMQAVVFQDSIYITTVIGERTSRKAVSHEKERAEFLEMISECWDESHKEQLVLFQQLNTDLRFEVN